MCVQFDYDIDEMLYLTLSNEINEIEAKSALFISSVRTLKECFGERNIRQRAKSDKKREEGTTRWISSPSLFLLAIDKETNREEAKE